MLVFAEKRENMVIKENNIIFFVVCPHMCENTRVSSCSMGCTMGCTMVVLWLFYGFHRMERLVGKAHCPLMSAPLGAERNGKLRSHTGRQTLLCSFWRC